MTDVNWLDLEQNDTSMNLSFPSVFADYLTETLSDSLKSKFYEIGEIWRFVGFYDSYRENESEEIRNKFINLADEFLLKNRRFRDEGLKYRHYKLQEVNKILHNLSLPSFQLPEDSETLIKQNQILQKKYDELIVIRNERMSKLERLEAKIQKISTLLGDNYHPTKFLTDIPNEMELKSLALILLDKEKILSDRKHRYESLKSSLIKLIDELEYKLEDDDENNLIKLNKDEVIYSQSCINKIVSFIRKLTSLREIMEQKIQNQHEILLQLYDRLDIDQEERNCFLIKLNSSLPKQQKLLESEIAKYELMKKSCMKKIITNIRSEIQILFDKCRVSNIDGYLMDSNEYTEELLDEIEKEFEKLKKFYNIYQEVFEKFIEFEDSMERLIELERKSTDPNRFNNRGGALLQMERDRKLFSKKLPKLEKEIRTLIQIIEGEHGISIYSYGLNVDEYFESNWQQLKDCKTIPTKQFKTQYGSNNTKKLISSNAGGGGSSNKRTKRIPFSPRTVNQPINCMDSDEQPLPKKKAKSNDIDEMTYDPEKEFQMGINLYSTMIDAENNFPHMNLESSTTKTGIKTRLNVKNRRRSKSYEVKNRIPIAALNSSNSIGYCSSSTNSTNVKTMIPERPPFLP